MDIKLDFRMQHQTQDNWCWAAGTASVAEFFGSTIWTQCLLAEKEFGVKTCCKDGSSAECNRPWFPNRSLATVDAYRGYHGGPLQHTDITMELTASTPLGIGVKWRGGGGHFVVISGILGASAELVIDDPWYGRAVVGYSEFCANYRQEGMWVDTYLIKSPNIVTGSFSEGSRRESDDVPSRLSSEDVNMSHELPVYASSLAAAAEGDPLASAEMVGTQVFTTDSALKATVETSEGGRYSFDSEGYNMLGTLIERTPSEVRILQIPSLYITAVWIPGVGAAGDRVIPISPVPTFLEDGRDYTPSDFKRAIRHAAERRLAFDRDEEEERARLRR